MSIRKALPSVIAGSALLLGAGAAAAATPVNNTYVVKATIKPLKSGTRSHPRPISSTLEWDVHSQPPGQRPANVSRYSISYQGIDENTTLFKGCSTSTLSAPNATVNSCPRGSRVGSGYLIFAFGATGFTNASYNPMCASSVAVFNGGYHDLTLFVYEGQPAPGQPTQCSIPNNHVAINVKIRHSRRGLTESFSMPVELLHPAPGFDTAVIQGVIGIPVKQRVVTNRSGTRRQVGLFESYVCPPRPGRQVAITFTREDGIAHPQATRVPCP